MLRSVTSPPALGGFIKPFAVRAKAASVIVKQWTTRECGRGLIEQESTEITELIPLLALFAPVQTIRPGIAKIAEVNVELCFSLFPIHEINRLPDRGRRKPQLRW